MNICNRSEPGLSEKKRKHHMGNHKLASSDCEKDIGIHVDEHLPFDKHINHIINKANRVLAITRISRLLNIYIKELSGPSWNMPHLSGTHI